MELIKTKNKNITILTEEKQKELNKITFADNQTIEIDQAKDNQNPIETINQNDQLSVIYSYNEKQKENEKIGKTGKKSISFITKVDNKVWSEDCRSQIVSRKVSWDKLLQTQSNIRKITEKTNDSQIDKHLQLKCFSMPVLGIQNDFSVLQDEVSETKSCPQPTFRKEILEEKELPKYVIIIVQIFMFQIQAAVQVFFTQTLGQLVVSHGASNSQLAVWSLQNYPWAFKFLLAPLMETYYSERLGPRKTYFVCTSIIIALYVLFISFCMEYATLSSFLMSSFTILIFILMIIISLNQISCQIWSVEMLKDENRHIANFTMQIGTIVGAILSYNIFIFLNNLQFCNQYIYSQPQFKPILIQSQYLQMLCIYIIVITLLVSFFFKDYKEIPHENIKERYQNILCVLRNKKLLNLSLFFLISPIMMGPVGAESGIILLRKGIQVFQADQIQMYSIPFSIFFVYIGHKLSLYKKELTMYLVLQMMMLGAGVFQYFIVQNYNQFTNEQITLLLLKVQVILSSSLSSMQAILIVSFYIRNLDPDPRFSLIWLQFNYCVFALKTDITATLYIYLMNFYSYESLCTFSFIVGTLYYVVCARWLIKYEIMPKYEFEAIIIEDSIQYENFQE